MTPVTDISGDAIQGKGKKECLQWDQGLNLGLGDYRARRCDQDLVDGAICMRIGESESINRLFHTLNRF